MYRLYDYIYRREEKAKTQRDSVSMLLVIYREEREGDEFPSWLLVWREKGTPRGLS